jgi:hypothetical protein
LLIALIRENGPFPHLIPPVLSYKHLVNRHHVSLTYCWDSAPQTVPGSYWSLLNPWELSCLLSELILSRRSILSRSLPVTFIVLFVSHCHDLLDLKHLLQTHCVLSRIHHFPFRLVPT